VITSRLGHRTDRIASDRSMPDRGGWSAVTASTRPRRRSRSEARRRPTCRRCHHAPTACRSRAPGLAPHGPGSPRTCTMGPTLPCDRGRHRWLVARTSKHPVVPQRGPFRASRGPLPGRDAFDGVGGDRRGLGFLDPGAMGRATNPACTGEDAERRRTEAISHAFSRPVGDRSGRATPPRAPPDPRRSPSVPDGGRRHPTVR
jgi:hypothetical protein